MMKDSLGRRRGHRRTCGDSFAGDLLRRYEAWLTGVRGLASNSVLRHSALIRDMLRGLRVRHRRELTAWKAELIERYVSRQARRCPPSGRLIASCTRSFLRFLLQEGLIPRDLAGAVPRCAYWRLAPLPQTLRVREVRRLTEAPDASTPLGLRNRAILLCLGELGLRASDVAGLELNTIDFTTGVLRLRRCKEREGAVLPMTPRLAAALNAYLRRGRPTCASSSLFVLHRAPVGKSISTKIIYEMVMTMATRVGLRDRVGGSHVFRRSLASRMINAGATLKQIADLLGHASLNTTSIYAKVDLRTLSRTALPWPGRREVCS
jgi:site-specific recombinase XerD